MKSRLSQSLIRLPDNMWLLLGYVSHGNVATKAPNDRCTLTYFRLRPLDGSYKFSDFSFKKVIEAKIYH